MDKAKAKECRELTDIAKTLDRKSVLILKNSAEVLKARQDMDEEEKEEQ